MTDTVKGYYYD